MHISHFASTINHPLCQYFQTVSQPQSSSTKPPLNFLIGDPAAHGNNSFKIPQSGYQALKSQIIKPDSHGYINSSGVPIARTAILKLYKPKNKITKSQVLIQHGVNQGLLVALMAFTNPGDQILIPQTGYPIFQKLAPSLNIKVIPYNLKHDDNYQIDLQHLQTLLTDKTQFLFIINPSNPFGTVFTLEHMQNILKFCDKHQLPIVADQIYHGQVFDQYQFYSFGDVTDDVPVIVFCGVQKIFNVPGWSTSWTILFDKHSYLSNIWKNMQTLGTIFLHTNKFTQLALPNIIDKVGLANHTAIQSTKSNHDFLFKQFNKLKGYKAVEAHGTFYMVIIFDPLTFIDIKTDIQYVQKLTQQENVTLLPLSIFGGNQQGFRLLTFLKPEIYQDLLQRISDFNQRHQNK